MAEWTAAPAWIGVAEARRGEGAGVVARPLERLGLATVLARKGQAAALAQKVAASYGLDLPAGPRHVAGEGIAFVATSPDAWLAVCENADARWFADLKAELVGLASVSDQSDGYAAIRLEGDRVADMLAKGVFLDLHLGSFPVGSAAGVSVAHIGVVMWRRAETSFDLLCFRSYANSFWHWIEESAAEYGLAVASA